MERCFRTVRQSELGHHRISGRRYVDQTIASGLVGAWRSDRTDASSGRLSRSRQSFRRPAWLLSFVRRTQRIPFRKIERARTYVGDTETDIQILPLRFDITSLYGLRSDLEAEIPSCTGASGRSR